MMKKILISSLLVVLVSCPWLVYGQLNYTSVNYMISLPMSDTKDYIGEASFRGFGFETGKFINDNVAIGIGFAWNVFNEQIIGELVQTGTSTLSGKQFRYINSFPIYANASYYFSSEDAKIKTYAGLGVGTISKIQRTEIGQFAFEDKKWHFALLPHAGILFAMGPDAHINLNARYHQAFETSDSNAVSYLSINLGLHYIFF